MRDQYLGHFAFVYRIAKLIKNGGRLVKLLRQGTVSGMST